MSTGAEPQAAFIQGNQGPMEQDATQSTILYLFQEASKLASPAHNSLLDSNMSPTSCSKTSRQDAFMVKREAKEPHSFHASNCSSQYSSSHMWPYNQAKNGTEDSHSYMITTSVEPGPQCNSPWEVMSLINLQCERLLHHRDLEELHSSPVSSTTKSGHSTSNSSASASGATGQGLRCDSASPECTFGCLSVVSEREANPACHSPTEDMMSGEWRAECSEGSGAFPAQRCVKHSEVGRNVQPQTPEKIDPARLELVDKNTTVYSQPAYRDTMEVKLSVITGLEWNEESERDCFSAGHDTLNVSSSENLVPQTHVSAASDDTVGPQNQQFSCNSDKDASVAVCPSSSAMEYLISEPAPTLDFNSNLVWTAESPSDRQLPPQSSFPPSSQPVLIEQNGKIIASKPECRRVPMEEKSPPVPRLKSPSHMGETNPPGSSTSKPEPREVPAEGSAHPSPQQCSSTSTQRTKTPRKQPHPSRSADIQDPDFQGVMFRMHTELDASREQCRLVITSKYSKGLYKSVRKPRLKSRSSQSSLRTSSSDEESDPTTSIAKSKVCASCCTRKTPMWRDAEDGTPLCNACGIRYKKYRVRCVRCWHIPRKEGNSNSCCLKCGNFVGLTSAQRKHTA